MAAGVQVRARMDGAVRDQAAAVLAEFGLTISDIIRVTLTRVAHDKALPFDLVPNAETRAAMAESRAIMEARKARFAGAKELFDALGQKDG
jgi:DNA-damage-inducible protein J